VETHKLGEHSDTTMCLNRVWPGLWNIQEN